MKETTEYLGAPYRLINQLVKNTKKKRHIYQSSIKGEVTLEIEHKIGVKPAKEYSIAKKNIR